MKFGVVTVATSVVTDCSTVLDIGDRVVDNDSIVLPVEEKYSVEVNKVLAILA